MHKVYAEERSKRGGCRSRFTAGRGCGSRFIAGGGVFHISRVLKKQLRVLSTLQFVYRYTVCHLSLDRLVLISFNMYNPPICIDL